MSAVDPLAHFTRVMHARLPGRELDDRMGWQPGTHRQNYTPPPQRRRRFSNRLLMTAALGAAVVGIWAFVLLQAMPQPTASDVAQQSTLTTLDTQQLTELRLQAFRAGQQSALQAGCRPVSLHMPILGVSDR